MSGPPVEDVCHRCPLSTCQHFTTSVEEGCSVIPVLKADTGDEGLSAADRTFTAHQARRSDQGTVVRNGTPARRLV
ncbi:hypothetical protein PoB_007341500 [Plakobranchus ocellatus]|uniref:Uncharacterized protein n=1 Tax=Plakobranchus ocellatus TaxID=259542 RepID=A0AAV4DSE6_9GAST|nr:hypothetical protein PoB_007341500 [Plakobranchus ocellatus]